MIDPEIKVALTPLKFPIATPGGLWRPPRGVSHMIGSIDGRGQGTTWTGLGSVNITKTRVDTLKDVGWRYILGELGAEWLIEFDVVRVPREHRGRRYGLRLVAQILAQFSAGHTCHATILAEPSGWQSLKQRDRAPALAALDRHWRRLGFEGGEVRPDVPGRLMAMTVRDYTAPAIALGT